MKREEIESRLMKIIELNEDMPIPKEEIGMDMDIAEKGVNSLIFIKLIVILETEFEVEFDDSELDITKYRTLNDLADYIENMMENQ